MDQIRENLKLINTELNQLTTEDVELVQWKINSVQEDLKQILRYMYDIKSTLLVHKQCRQKLSVLNS